MTAYEAMIRATAKPYAPWYVVPADNKWFTRVIVAAAVIDALEALDLKFPEMTETQKKQLGEAREALVGNDVRSASDRFECRFVLPRSFSCGATFDEMLRPRFFGKVPAEHEDEDDNEDDFRRDNKRSARVTESLTTAGQGTALFWAAWEVAAEVPIETPGRA
jgi:hypothetical protein